MSRFYVEILSEAADQYSIIIEDNGKVCYAYLLNNQIIIGDVWLYNQEDTPETVAWDNRSKMPFLNPYTTKEQPAPVKSDSDILVLWQYEATSLKQVRILIRNELIAILEPGLKPGYSKLTNTDNPLAKVLR